MTYEVKCGACRGSGTIPAGYSVWMFAPEEPCPACKGKGHVVIEAPDPVTDIEP